MIWEYRVIFLPPLETSQQGRESREDILNLLGVEGWELVQIDGVVATLKRCLREPAP